MSNDFLKIQKGISLGSYTSDPVSGQNGDIYYNSSLLKFRKFQSGAWEDLDTTGGGGGGGSQEFYQRIHVLVRAASTANVNIATVANGTAFNGLSLVTNDLILLKNQTLPEDNGVYIVGAVAGTTVRDVSADTIAELNGYVAYATAGTTGRDTFYYQTATLTSLADPQVWSTTAPTFTFTVPVGVGALSFLGWGSGGGGGGGGGGIDGAQASGGGGGGGGGSQLLMINSIAVTPGEMLTVTVGSGGARGIAGASSGSGTAGGTGINTTITGFATGVTLTLPGGGPGGAGTAGGGAGGGGAGGASSLLANFVGGAGNSPGGAGGNRTINNVAVPASGSVAAFANIFGTKAGVSGGTGGVGAGGGGGGPGGGAGGSGPRGIGGIGGNGGNNGGAGNPGTDAATSTWGCGGGGGGAGTEAGSQVGARGGYGSRGYLIITW